MIFFNRGSVFLLTLVLFLSACSTNKKEVLPEVVQVERVIPYHIVVEGESVGSIAEEHGMTRAELIKLNELVPPYQLYNGQRLVINIKVGQTETDAVEVDTVKDAENSTNNSPDTQSSPQGEEDHATIDDLNGTSATPVSNEQSVPTIEESEYIWPIIDGKSKISQNFGQSTDGGIIMQVSAGTPVKAMADGVIRIARALDGEASSYGKTVIILHGSKSKLSVYSHLQEYSVKANQKVKKGDIIGKVGKSGNAKSPQLYFQVFDVNKQDKSRVAIDPEKILP